MMRFDIVDLHSQLPICKCIFEHILPNNLVMVFSSFYHNASSLYLTHISLMDHSIKIMQLLVPGPPEDKSQPIGKRTWAPKQTIHSLWPQWGDVSHQTHPGGRHTSLLSSRLKGLWQRDWHYYKPQGGSCPSQLAKLLSRAARLGSRHHVELLGHGEHQALALSLDKRRVKSCSTRMVCWCPSSTVEAEDNNWEEASLGGSARNFTFKFHLTKKVLGNLFSILSDWFFLWTHFRCIHV